MSMESPDGACYRDCWLSMWTLVGYKCVVCCGVVFFFFFFKQKTAYEMCGRDWSSDVCSSDLAA